MHSSPTTVAPMIAGKKNRMGTMIAGHIEWETKHIFIKTTIFQTVSDGPLPRISRQTQGCKYKIRLQISSDLISM